MYSQWLLPTPDLMPANLSKYQNRPVGNSPEFMPWDLNLNQDVHLAVQRHVAATKEFLDEDERKFTLSTPKRGAKAYLKVINPVHRNIPSSRASFKTLTKL